MGAVIVAVIAVLVALGCFIAITMSDFRGKKPGNKQVPPEKPEDEEK